jgi:hypothetical protein
MYDIDWIQNSIKVQHSSVIQITMKLLIQKDCEIVRDIKTYLD